MVMISIFIKSSFISIIPFILYNFVMKLFCKILVILYFLISSHLLACISKHYQLYVDPCVQQSECVPVICLSLVFVYCLRKKWNRRRCLCLRCYMLHWCLLLSVHLIHLTMKISKDPFGIPSNKDAYHLQFKKRRKLAKHRAMKWFSYIPLTWICT